MFSGSFFILNILLVSEYGYLVDMDFLLIFFVYILGGWIFLVTFEFYGYLFFFILLEEDEEEEEEGYCFRC